MPLFMDIHKFDEVSIEDVKKAHYSDKSVQDQYGVKYHQFWVNEESGNVYCLVEGPDKATCELVHREAHGYVACNIAEVEPGFFKLFMDNGQPVDQGLVQNADGSADPGYRHIMVVDIRANTHITRSEDYKYLVIPHKPKNLVLDRVSVFNGRVVERLGDDSLVAVFSNAVNAIRCAKDLQHEFLKRKTNKPDELEWDICFRIGLFAGDPLTEDSGFFAKALAGARHLCLMARNDEVVLSSLISKGCNLEDISSLKVLTPSEEKFVGKLFELTENNLSNKNFKVGQMGRQLGISRPQLYRKILSLSGRSPNEFISALRMSKALTLMKQNFGNISEIALEVGYHNPSYFSKCFQKSYGCTPSEFIRVGVSVREEEIRLQK